MSVMYNSVTSERKQFIAIVLDDLFFKVYSHEYLLML